MRRPLLLVLLLASACGGPRSPYLRVTHDSGRVYYTRTDRALYIEKGGILTFRDLVTKEEVTLDGGTFVAQECPQTEVEIRQREYLDNPRRLPGEGE